MIRKLLTWWCSTFIYCDKPYNETCCCGQGMKDHSVMDNHSPRCEKEYAVACWVDCVLNK